MLLLMLMLAMIAVSQEEGFLGKDLNRVIWPSAVVVGCVGSFEKAALWQCVSYFSNASATSPSVGFGRSSPKP